MARVLWIEDHPFNFVEDSDDEAMPEVVTSNPEVTDWPCTKEVLIAVNALRLNNDTVWVNMDWLPIGDHNEGWIGQKDEEEHAWYLYDAFETDWMHRASYKIKEYIEDRHHW